MVVKGEKWMIQDLSRIWEVCFGDSQEYIRLFMERRFFTCEPLVWLEDRQVMGVVYLLPCLIEGRKAYYGSAGGVLPHFRKRGIFENLLDYAAWFCEQRNATFIFVPISGSEEYYRKRGFQASFFFSRKKFLKEGTYMSFQLHEADAESYTKIRDRKFSAYPYLRWDESAVDYALAENRFCGGFAKIVTAHEDDDNIIFGRKNGNVLEILETTLDPETAKKLIPFFCATWNTDEVIFQFPIISDEDKIPNGGSFGHLNFQNGWMGLSLA